MRRVSLACLLGISLSAGTLFVKAWRRRRRSCKSPLESLKDALVALALARTPSTSREVLNQGVRRYDREIGAFMPCLSRRCVTNLYDIYPPLEARDGALSLLLDGGTRTEEEEEEEATDADAEVLDAYLRQKFSTRASVVEFLREFLAATGHIAAGRREGSEG